MNFSHYRWGYTEVELFESSLPLFTKVEGKGTQDQTVLLTSKYLIEMHTNMLKICAVFTATLFVPVPEEDNLNLHQQ